MRSSPSRFTKRRCARRTTNESSSRMESTLYRSGTRSSEGTQSENKVTPNEVRLARPRENPWGSEELRKKMGCSNSKVSSLENFDKRWNNKTGLCLALRFEAGEEKSLRLKCGIEKKGYHTKCERKKETPIPEDVARDSELKGDAKLAKLPKEPVTEGIEEERGS